MGVMLLFGMGHYSYASDKKKTWLERSLIPPNQKKERVFIRKRQFKALRHDQAQEAVRSGKILSLSQIKQAVNKRYKGRVVDVALAPPRAPNLPYYYHIKLLQRDGRLLLIMVNAQNAQIARVRGGR